jgi:uridine kinase
LQAKEKADIVINSGMNDMAFDMIKTEIESALGEE